MKDIRHQRIIELINTYEIETQEELLERLKHSGVDVTQATISRDIRELKISKIVLPNGASKYTVPAASEATVDAAVSEKFRRHFREGVTTMEFAGNMLVIKTLSGMAMGVAAALDHINKTDIIGSIAGDDTVFAVIRDTSSASGVIEQLRGV
ncbi:MAG: arginine repressor [Defluviitaleaceae bacterium]|nr:arginine repressor [Defluviitaleaceae bacterium]